MQDDGFHQSESLILGVISVHTTGNYAGYCFGCSHEGPAFIADTDSSDAFTISETSGLRAYGFIGYSPFPFFRTILDRDSTLRKIPEPRRLVRCPNGHQMVFVNGSWLRAFPFDHLSGIATRTQSAPLRYRNPL